MNDNLLQTITTVLVTRHMREIDRLQAEVDALGSLQTLPLTLSDFKAENPHMALYDYVNYVLDQVSASATK
jgi:hypothetical protein